MKFTCQECGTQFVMPEEVMERYPGWEPRKCSKCHNKKQRAPSTGAGGATGTDPVAGLGTDPVAATRVPVTPGLERDLLQLTLEATGGPTEGVFTDGGCSGNPGPGGWGAVLVRAGKVVEHLRGEHPNTTNNRMELVALLAAYGMLGADDAVTIWTDSQLCVNTFNEWAAGWEKRGWKRKGGAIKNLDLIKPLYELIKSRPRVQLCWIKAHDGSRWNEYADLLATAHIKR